MHLSLGLFSLLSGSAFHILVQDPCACQGLRRLSHLPASTLGFFRLFSAGKAQLNFESLNQISITPLIKIQSVALHCTWRQTALVAITYKAPQLPCTLPLTWRSLQPLSHTSLFPPPGSRVTGCFHCVAVTCSAGLGLSVTQAGLP